MVNSAIKAMGEPGEIDGEDEDYQENKSEERSYDATYKKVKENCTAILIIRLLVVL